MLLLIILFVRWSYAEETVVAIDVVVNYIVVLGESYAEAAVVVAEDVVVQNIVVLGENFAEETVVDAVVDVVVDNIVC